MPDYNVWHVCEYGAVLEYDDSSGLIIVHPNLGNQGDLKKGNVEALLAEKRRTIQHVIGLSKWRMPLIAAL